MIKHADLLHTETKQQIKRGSEASKEHPKEYKSSSRLKNRQQKLIRQK